MGSLMNGEFTAMPPPATPETGRGKWPNLTGNFTARNMAFIACPCSASCRCVKLGCTDHWAHSQQGGPDWPASNSVLTGYRAFWGPTPDGESKKSTKIWRHHQELTGLIDETNGLTALCDTPGLVESRHRARERAYELLGTNHMLATKFVSLRSPDCFPLIVDQTLVQENLKDSYPDLQLAEDHSSWTIEDVLALEDAIIAELIEVIELGQVVKLADGERVRIDSVPAIRHASRMFTCAFGRVPGTFSRFVDLAHRDRPKVGAHHVT